MKGLCCYCRCYVFTTISMIVLSLLSIIWNSTRILELPKTTSSFQQLLPPMMAVDLNYNFHKDKDKEKGNNNNNTSIANVVVTTATVVKREDILLSLSSSSSSLQQQQQPSKISSSSKTTTATTVLDDDDDDDDVDAEAVKAKASTSTGTGTGTGTATTTTTSSDNNNNNNNVTTTKASLRSKKDLKNGQQRHYKQQQNDDEQQQQQQQVIFFDDDDDATTTKSCWLSIENNATTFIGCGAQGQTFKTTMYCTIIKNNMEEEFPTTNDDVVLKLATTKPPEPLPSEIKQQDQQHLSTSTTSSTYKCIDESPSKINDYKRINEILFFPSSISISNRTTTTATTTKRSDTMRHRKHFHVPFATVQIPIHILYTNLQNDVKQMNNKRCNDIIHYNNNPNTNTTIDDDNEDVEAVIGTISEIALGRSLSPDTLIKGGIDSRHRLLRQVVCIWNHMFHRKFIHQDIQFHNLFFDGHIASLIDFTSDGSILLEESENNNNENNNELLQIIQLYQLLTLMGHICMRRHKYFVLQNHVSIQLFEHQILPKQNYIIPKLQYALEKCKLLDDDSNGIIDDDYYYSNLLLSSSSSSSLMMNVTTTNITTNTTTIPSLLPSLIFDYYEKVKTRKNNNVANDNVDVVFVQQIYEILSKWTTGSSSSSSSSSVGGGDDDEC